MKQPSHFNDLSMLRSQTPSHLQTRSVAPSIRLLAGNYTLNLGVMHFSPELHHIAAWPQVLWHSRIRLTRSNSDPVMMLSSQSLGRWQIPHMPKSSLEKREHHRGLHELHLYFWVWDFALHIEDSRRNMENPSNWRGTTNTTCIHHWLRNNRNVLTFFLTFF